MWRHVGQWWIPAALVLTATSLLYVVLFWLAGIGVDPVNMAAAFADEPQYRQHGKPVFNSTGLLAWSFAVLVYGVVVSLTSPAPSRWARCSLCVALTTLLIVAFVHPLWIPVLLPPALRSGYVSFVGGMSWLPIGASQRTLDLKSVLTWVVMPHSFITVVTTFALSRRTPPREPEFND